MAEMEYCPFCGSIDVDVAYEGLEPYGSHFAHCFCTKCGADGPGGVGNSKDAAIEDAIAEWNRRAERTCRVECYPPGYEDNLHYEVCSECGTILTASRPGDRHATRASYCPWCGARVEVNE